MHARCAGADHQAGTIGMDGIITDIQSFSLHDGPGIRSTVFLKGCNMRCAWCHNPETFSARPQFFYYEEKCTRCRECVNCCPQQAIEMDGDRMLRNVVCGNCGACERVCVNDAVKRSGKSVSAVWVVQEVLRDRAFYEQSGGGVTLSGGEVMMQPDFAAAILAGCKAQEIHTCVESNMSMPFDHCRAVIELCDLVIMDIKLWDREKHRQWTGIGNEQVLANFQELAARNVPVIVRTPIVAGVNDDEAEIAAIAKFVAGAGNVLAYELLAYHDMGVNKRVALGMEENITFAPVDARKMARLRDFARN